MELKLLKKNLINCARKKNKIFILGRGYSTSLFLKNLNQFKKKNLIIGFNTNEIIDKLDFYFTNKNIIPKAIPKKKIFEINYLRLEIN